jgi:hypothetical protein
MQWLLVLLSQSVFHSVLLVLWLCCTPCFSSACTKRRGSSRSKNAPPSAPESGRSSCSRATRPAGRARRRPLRAKGSQANAGRVVPDAGAEREVEDGVAVPRGGFSAGFVVVYEHDCHGRVRERVRRRPDCRRRCCTLGPSSKFLREERRGGRRCIRIGQSKLF